MYAFSPQTYPQKLWVSAAACLTLFSVVLPPSATASATPGNAQAVDFLAIESHADGRCQNLSEGGKLVVLRNTHPERLIAYRLVRMFAKVPQGRVVGVVEPDSEGQRLGCNRVDGRDQSWRIERAAFK